MKKERPILFNTDMVRALLKGRKNQTRRTKGLEKINEKPGEWFTPVYNEKTQTWDFTSDTQIPERIKVICPYGLVGDVLWVRESWKVGAWREDGRIAIDYKAYPNLTNTPWIYFKESVFQRLVKQSFQDLIKSNTKVTSGNFFWNPGESPCRFRPSIHMPKEACRIKLEIVSMGVERLWSISQLDAFDEGVLIHGSTTKGENFSVTNIFYVDYMDLGGKAYANPINSFLSLWESINGEKSMNSNPWVWRIEFKIIK